MYDVPAIEEAEAGRTSDPGVWASLGNRTVFTFFLPPVLVTEPSASHRLDKHSTTEIYLMPQDVFL